MRAAIVEKPGVLVVKDIPTPEIGEYDALCELLYGATCTGTDQHIIFGRLPWKVKYPTILGHESIGRVVEVGQKVRNFRKGDLVTRVGTLPSPRGEFGVTWGGFAEFGIARDHWAMREDGLPQAEWNDFRVNQIVPPEFDPAASTMIITWRETLSYLSRMGVGQGISLLIIGSGGNGLSFVAQAKNLGATRITMVGNAKRENIAQEAGVTDYFDYKADNLMSVIAEDCSDGFDFIIDAVGKRGQMDKFLPLLKPGGTVGIYGIDDYDECQINPRNAPGTFTYYNGGYDEEETHNTVVSFMEKGLLNADLWLDLEHPFLLEEINKAFEAVRQRKMVKALVNLAPRHNVGTNS